MSKAPSAMHVSKEEVSFLERTLGGLPASQSASAGTGDADGLLKFSYHQNPYLRTYAKVLWSGYAIARGQLVDGHQRFSQARRDATVSAVDALTTKALDDANTALEAAMAPDGTITNFLTTLREKTLQRLWTRVCETSGLPPPRFHLLLGKSNGVSAAELDAEDEAELATLLKNPPPPPPPVARSDDDDDDGDGDVDDDEDDGEGGGDGAVPEKLQVTVQRRGGAETAAELLLTGAAELLRELRAKRPSGALTITITVDGESAHSGQGGGAGDRKRGRRRRRR